MFGFGKKARQEKAKREALEIGERAVGNFNDALSRWRELSLESRRTMIDNDFAERLLSLEVEGGLCFETAAEIDGLACMKNWIEGTAQYRQEFAQIVDDEAMQCLAAIGVEAEAENHLERHIDEVTAELEQDIDVSITEATQRRGETVRRAGRRNLAERSVDEFGYLESLNVMELMVEARSMAKSEPSRSSMVAFMRRFYEIAFHEHGISEEERHAALSTAQAFEADIVASHDENDEGLAIFLEAVKLDKERGKRTGFGSLHWKMEDEGVSVGDLIAYIARVENASLLPDYLGMMDGGVISEIRAELLHDIVVARQSDGASTIEILGGLVEASDPVVIMLLEPFEVQALQNWRSHREQAEQVIEKLELRRQLT
jgi:hypothetical protein